MTDNKTIVLRPFIRWAGGKQNLISVLLSKIPNDYSGTYFEPFLGAGSLFLAGGFNKSFISDINPHVINAYLKIKSDPEKIYFMLQEHTKKFNEAYYYELRSDFNSNKSVFTFRKASIFIFLIHTSFNGIYRVNKKGEYNVPIGKLRPSLPSKEHLIKISERLATA